jgi:hypothetical protein
MLGQKLTPFVICTYFNIIILLMVKFLIRKNPPLSEQAIFKDKDAFLFIHCFITAGLSSCVTGLMTNPLSISEIILELFLHSVLLRLHLFDI